ncbi:hypothetical protein EXIGLDRAFT_704647 [Exidia glandulosa HHB12029]|uniref:Uncharacterized protein n=1 Tax=Exidia glandulosa HHB12029 TaxID=1314781 RepID=A0A165KU54_EXIGL|nr:hypothetical protein EXIGLDRAFT_704647 [Exidia glandulosa HHB12029]
MLARPKVSRPASPPPPLPQYTLTQGQNYTKASLQSHEKLRRLGEAATDVFCAGIEALFDRWGTQRMSQRMHRVTKSVQTSSSDIFQSPYAKLHVQYLEQKARVDELSAQLAGETASPQKMSEQNALIDQLRSTINPLEQRIAEQEAKIARLESQLDAAMVFEERAREQEQIIAALTPELELLRVKSSEQQRLIEQLREELAELQEMKEVVKARDAVIEDLRRQIVEDETEHEALIAKHEKAVTELHDELTPLRTRVEEQVGKITELSAEAENAKTYEMRVAEQEARIRDMQALLEADKVLQSKVNEQDMLVNELRAALSSHETDLSYEREHATLLQKELGGMEKEVTSLREKASSMENELQQARARMKEMERSASPTGPGSPRMTPTRRPTQPLPWYMQRYSSTGSSSGADDEPCRRVRDECTACKLAPARTGHLRKVDMKGRDAQFFLVWSFPTLVVNPTQPVQHAPYANLAEDVVTKGEAYDEEHNANVLLRYQLQEVRTRLQLREATIAEHEWIVDAHARLQERNTELVEELSRATEMNRWALEDRDEEIRRLQANEEDLRYELLQAKEAGDRAILEKDTRIERLHELVQSLQPRQLELATPKN